MRQYPTPTPREIVPTDRGVLLRFDVALDRGQDYEMNVRLARRFAGGLAEAVGVSVSGVVGGVGGLVRGLLGR